MNSDCVATCYAVGNMTSIPKPADLSEDLTCTYERRKGVRNRC